MLYFDLERVLRMRGITKPNKFLTNLGFAPATVRNILRGQVWRIDLANLERFCLALNCTPNDLLEWQPPEDRADADAQALSKLKRDGSDDLPKLLQTLPLEQFEQITTVLRGMQNEQK